MASERRGPDPSRGFSLGEASPRWWIMLLALLAGSVWLYARGGEVNAPETRIDGPTMGTRYRVVVVGEVEDRSGLRETIEKELDRVVALMSTYEPESELSRFNASKSLEPFDVSEETVEVLTIAREVTRRSQGAFDVTVGPLVNLYGFGPHGRPDSAPSDEQIQSILEYVGPERWSLSQRELSKTHPQVEIDLSAVAKGYAVDQVAKAVREAGYDAFLVEVGGEVRTEGAKANGGPFRVGVEAPREDTQAVHAVFAMSGQSLATSGNYRVFYERDGVRYVHTLDPRSGKPVAHRLLSASVMHESCAWADAWATALMASGEDAWRLAQENDLEVLLLYAGPEGTLEEKITDHLSALRLNPDSAALAEK